MSRPQRELRLIERLRSLLDHRVEHVVFGARERWGMFKGSNATVLPNLGQVDVVQEIPGLPAWDHLVAESERYELEDLTVTVMARSTLIALKRRRRSHLDLADIEAIEMLDRLDD